MAASMTGQVWLREIGCITVGMYNHVTLLEPNYRIRISGTIVEEFGEFLLLVVSLV